MYFIDTKSLSRDWARDEELVSLKFHNDQLATRADMAEARVRMLERDNAIAFSALRRISRADMAPVAIVATDALRQMLTV